MRVVILTRAPWWMSFRHARMVDRLAGAGHEIVAIVVERVRTIAALQDWIAKLGLRLVATKAIRRILGRVFDVDRSSSSGRSANRPAPATRTREKVFRVSSHNSSRCVHLLRTLAPEIAVLRNCGILKPPVLEVPSVGTLNPHYGILPTFRGVDVTEWAVLCGEPVVVTVHWVLEGVDTGASLAAREVPIASDDTLSTLREKSAVLAVELFIEALDRIAIGSAPAPTCPAEEGRQYYRMHRRLRALAEARLRRRQKGE